MAGLRTIELRKGKSGFGFNLSRVEGRNVFRVVDEGGPAAVAGAKPGDQIMSVGGVSVVGASHGDLVKAIKAAGDTVRMEVKAMAAPAAAGGAGAPQHPQQQRDGPGVSSKTLPIEIHKGSGGFGFNLSRVNNMHVFRVVDAGGAADKAGARPGDCIVAINGHNVERSSHGEVVGLIKASGGIVKMDIRVAIGTQVGAGGAAGVNPAILEAQRRAEKERDEAVNRAKQAIDRAKEDTQRALDERREAEERLGAVRQAEQQQLELSDELKRLEARLEKVLQVWGEVDDEVEAQMTQTKSVASYTELRDFEDLMGKVEESAKTELKAELAKLKPGDDELTKRVNDKSVEVKYAELGEELSRIRLGELKRLTEEARKRREEEAHKEEKKHLDIKAARERDMALLKEKQERMDRMLREAQEKKQAEEDARIAALEEKERLRADERKERAHEIEQMKFERQQAKQKRQLEEERRRAREEEERAYAEKDEARRRSIAQQKQEQADEESRRKNAANLFGGALKSRPPPSQDEKSVHPMIALMAKQKEQDTRF